ncbi:MAG: ComEC/Rec2 family competence protein [Planctomycetota bacterium]
MTRPGDMTLAGDGRGGLAFEERKGGGGLVWLAVAWMSGIVLARWTGSAWPGWWVVLVAGLGVVVGVACGGRLETRRLTEWGAWRRGRVGAVAVLGLAVVMGLGWVWYGVRVDRMSGDDVRAWTTDRGQLVSLRGVVTNEPRSGPRASGAMAAFDYRRGRTAFELDVEAMQRLGHGQEQEPTEVRWRQTSGRVLVSVSEPMAQVERGQRVDLTGWLSAIGGPMNPGEFDYAAFMADRGITGRVSVRAREAVALTGNQPRGLWLAVQRARSRVGSAADASLAYGFRERDPMLGLLRALLLGRRAQLPEDTEEDFRRVGLAHILSISGAHLGVLLGMVWLAARVVTGRPRRAALVVMVVLGLFVLAVPMRTPIVRAAVMAALFCWGAWSGRRVSAVGLLALSAVIVLVWKPADLFGAGFQLSYAAVLGILLFTEPVLQRVWPTDPALEEQGGGSGAGWWLARRLVEALVVGAVAFVSVTPLVMLHFGMLSPLAVVLSTVAVLPLSVLLAVGYVKVLVGMLLPSVSLVLAGPLRWLSGVMTGLVEEASGWPGAGIEVVPLGGWWVMGALGFGAAAMAGWPGLGWRGWRLWSGVAVLGVWFGALQWAGPTGTDGGTTASWAVDGEASEPALEVLMLSVGDGSCFVVRCGGETLMFDCGSQQYTGIGIGTVVPTLRAFGIDRLSMLVISHADLDHFEGVLDVVDRVAVDRVVVSPDLRLEAAGSPRGAAAFLLRGLDARGVMVEEAAQGWQGLLGDQEDGQMVYLEAIWPDASVLGDGARGNDRSLVIRLTVAGRRVLLSGDIGEAGKRSLLALEQEAVRAGRGSLLRADVAELPHHGAYEEEVSESWIAAVDPSVVLQSSGRRRGGLGGGLWGERGDPWLGVLEKLSNGQEVNRLVSGTTGLVRLGVWPDGTLRWRTHLGRAEQSLGAPLAGDGTALD